MSGAHVRRRSVGERLLALATMVALLFLLLQILAPTARADTYTLDLPLLILHGDPGSEVVIYDGPMPVSGQDCSITVTNAANNTSVHVGNDIRLETNGQVVNFFDVERAPNVETPGDQSIVPGANGVLILTFGADHQFSAHISLEFDCEPLTTTTTTIAQTTTTAGDTTTTAGQTTTTVGETTTTAGGDTTTTIAETTTTPPDEVLGTEVLPFTGIETEHLGFLALSLLAAGSLLVLRFKEDEES